MNMAEVVFDGQIADGYCGECLNADITEPGHTRPELRKSVVQATAAVFFDQSDRLKIPCKEGVRLKGRRAPDQPHSLEVAR